MSYQRTVATSLMRRFAACQRGAATTEFTLIAIAMLIGIAVALDDIGNTLMASRDVAASSL